MPGLVEATTRPLLDLTTTETGLNELNFSFLSTFRPRKPATLTT